MLLPGFQPAARMIILVNRYSVSKVKNGDVGRNLQGETAGQRGARARRRSAREARRPARRIGGDRACAGALQQRPAGKKDGLSQDADRGNKGGCSSAIRRAPAHCGRETSWRQAQLTEPLAIRSLPWQAVRR